MLGKVGSLNPVYVHSGGGWRGVPYVMHSCFSPNMVVFVLLNNSRRPFVTLHLVVTHCRGTHGYCPITLCCCSAPFHRWDQKPRNTHSLFCHCLRPPPDPFSSGPHPQAWPQVNIPKATVCLGPVGLRGMLVSPDQGTSDYLIDNPDPCIWSVFTGHHPTVR